MNPMQTEESQLFEMMQLLMQRIMHEASYTLGLNSPASAAASRPCKCSIKVALAQILLHIRKGRALNYVNITYFIEETPVHVLVNVKKIIRIL